MFTGEGPSDECSSNEAVKELAMVWTGCGFENIGSQTRESACTSAEEELAPIKWSVVVHRHFGDLDADVDGRADDCAGYEVCFSVWHRVPDFVLA